MKRQSYSAARTAYIVNERWCRRMAADIKRNRPDLKPHQAREWLVRESGFGDAGRHWSRPGCLAFWLGDAYSQPASLAARAALAAVAGVDLKGRPMRDPLRANADTLRELDTGAGPDHTGWTPAMRAAVLKAMARCAALGLRMDRPKLP